MPARNQTKNYDERRASPRLPPSAIPSLKGVKLVAGPEVRLVNISRGGALIESEARLSPGSNLCLRLVTAESVYLLKGQVLRSRVASLAGGGLRYQSAVSFNEEFSILPQKERLHEAAHAATGELAAEIDEAGPSGKPAFFATDETRAEVDPPEYEVVTIDSHQSDFDLSKILGQNTW